MPYYQFFTHSISLKTCQHRLPGVVKLSRGLKHPVLANSNMCDMPERIRCRYGNHGSLNGDGAMAACGKRL